MRTHRMRSGGLLWANPDQSLLSRGLNNCAARRIVIEEDARHDGAPDSVEFKRRASDATEDSHHYARALVAVYTDGAGDRQF